MRNKAYCVHLTNFKKFFIKNKKRKNSNRKILLKEWLLFIVYKYEFYMNREDSKGKQNILFCVQKKILLQYTNIFEKSRKKRTSLFFFGKFFISEMLTFLCSSILRDSKNEKK